MDTARLGLPLLAVAQAQKEMTHNEALALLDFAVFPVVQAIGGSTPPTNPGEGEAWIVPPGAAGEWLGRANAIAGWSGGGWRFIMPRIGMTLWCVAEQTFVRFLDGQWQIGVVAGRKVMIGADQVVGARQPAIPAPSGGATIDSQARGVISSILSALETHGLIAKTT